MSIRRITLGLLALVTVVASLGASGATGATLVIQQPAGNCKKVGKGTAWSDQGQKGVLYTVEGNRPAACAVGIKWLVRLTNMTGAPKTPPGWQCIAAVAVAGQCETKSGAIFEWTAKRK